MSALARSLRASAGVALSIGLVATACYQYVPVQLAAVGPQENVRVVVTEASAARLASSLGTYTTDLEGRVAREAQDSVSISVPIDRMYRGRLMESGWQTLFVGRADVLQVHRKELSRTRTIALSVGAVVGFSLLVSSVVQWMDPNPSNGDPPPPPPEPSLRLFRILFR